MKKFLIILCLLALPFTPQVEAQTMGEKDNVSVAFGGFGYQQGINLSGGIATNIFNDVWTFKYVTVGISGTASLSVDVGVFYHFPDSKWSIGAIGGLGNDWLNKANDNISPISYMTSASGGMLNFSFSEAWGVTAHGEYNAALGSGNEFPDNYNFGLKIWSDI